MKFFATQVLPPVVQPPALHHHLQALLPAGARADAIARVQNQFVAMDPKGDAENHSKSHQ